MIERKVPIVVFLAMLVIGIAYVLVFSSANAQEQDAVPYEFAFSYDPAERADPEAEARMQERLADEAGDYCASVVARNDGITRSDCEAEITGAVNDSLDGETESDQYAQY